MKPIQIEEFEEQMKKRSDRLINYFLMAYFLIGLLFSFFYNTWDIAIGVGGSAVIAYYLSKHYSFHSTFYQYVLSAVIGIFMSQFIFQLHGMFEMHFFAFIGSAILITYRNWKLQLPLAAVLLLHHFFFGYLQVVSPDKVYFIQLDYTSLKTTIIHSTLTMSILSLCGLWSYNIKKASDDHIIQSIELGKLQEANKQKEVLIAMSDNLRINNEKLQEANKELRTIFNAIDEVLFSIDLVNNRIIQLSSTCEKVTGWTRTEFMADINLWIKLIHPDDLLHMNEKKLKLIEGKTIACTCRIIHKNGGLRWMEVKIIPTLDVKGELIRLDSIVKDVTERRKSEAALQESYKKIVAQKLLMKTTERLARFGSWQIDIQDEIVKWSDEAFRIYGYGSTEHEPSYEFFLNHVHPEDLEYVKATMEHAYLHLDSEKLNFRIIDRKGQTKYLYAELMIERNVDGEPIRVAGFKQDITEKVMLEQSLAEERSCKQKEITAAVINAQEQERSFLGEELHDNINPVLATAKLYMDSALENADIRIDLIKSTKEFITMAMDDIRKLSKSLLPPSLGEVSLLESLTDMIENISRVNDLHFIVNSEGFDESSISDKQKLTIFRIAQEQITNILKHAKANTVIISLKQRENYLQLIIKDDGVGFNTAKKRNGVGLQNIASRAELYNGNVTINSKLGKGCELVVNFNNQVIPSRNDIAKAS
ncbi:PAS domain-containing protein [Ferruginibacter lapsinanis]|uniref:PAS domain-containing sensor histidine kinase n=1 Tax=Ferruginibacter lapsinanis TaxID=563172 RepID=UPI001E34B98D|nr:PAS domain-containing protein [Ferruginibacter lapsinanis]UEG51235.1 PAS domain-containing protein [Ferruginibacter lapsinanis]